MPLPYERDRVASQQWHMDLLRGKYETYLAEVDIWGRPGADVFKVMMYLQDGDSLQIIPGSHLVPMSLERDDYAEPGDADEVMAIPVKAGDIAVMDIRTSHRGSTEEDFATGAFDANPRILISTALGRDGAKLTDAMEFGNGRRLMDWQAKHRKETPLTRPRDISSRSHSVNANQDRR